MIKPIDLAGMWRLFECPLSAGPETAVAILQATQESIPCAVPGDVSDSLVRAGRLPEPLVGVNFKQFNWINDRSWWLLRSVDVPESWRDLPGVELSLDGLDYGADIWINGQHVGRHDSVFYPFTHDVKAILLYGQSNTILVRLTTGHDVAEPFRGDPLGNATPLEASRGYSDRSLAHRIFLRKPAYVWGWDWGPYLATCGITGKTLLVPIESIHINDVSVITHLDEKDAIVSVCVELSQQTVYTTRRADITLTFTDQAGQHFSVTETNVSTHSGLTFVKMTCRIPNAKLWWPNGAGQQHRYQLSTTITCHDQVIQSHEMKVGLRTIEMFDKPDDFAFAVNGQRLFIKGGNWIPSDSLYGRISDQKLQTLVGEAANANFNCLRIWGGGRYEADAFYEACEEHGILIWHDFMSACSLLPADRDWFYRAFEAEARYQIRRLRSRACMMLWCGNNEVSLFYEALGFTYASILQQDPGWVLYHRLLPSLVHELCPHLPFRPSSPLGGETSVHDHHEGNCHHWMVMRPESKYWSNPWYWDTDEVPIFNTEYGYGGPCCLESTIQYLGTDKPYLHDETGRQHTNTFYDNKRVNFSIGEHYRDPQNLPLDQYIRVGGLCQGLNLGYSLESMRANPQTAGGIFWMYNDTWGENGWSIIDYYLRRKISYYNVKRSLAHQKLLLRRGGHVYGGSLDEMLLLALNDTPEKLQVQGSWGYLSYDGLQQDLIAVDQSVEPFSHHIIATIPMPSEMLCSRGTMVMIPDAASSLLPVSWLPTSYRTLNLPQANVRITEVARHGNTLSVTVSSDMFAHAVYLNVPRECRLSDHYFDLFAGMSRIVTIEDAGLIDENTLKVFCSNSDIMPCAEHRFDLCR